MGKPIFLVGYMGCGKSTLGKLLAEQLQLTYIDLDCYIEKRYRQSISDIFRTKGEIEFRRIEYVLLQEVAEFENVLISTGGGTPCFHNSMDLMNQKGTTIYLKASPELLFRRLQHAKSKRPIIANKTDEELIAFIRQNVADRSCYYEQSSIIAEQPNSSVGHEAIRAMVADVVRRIALNP